jgi:hypothetical protein
MFVRVTDPEAWFGREPVKAAQPIRGWFQPGIFQDVRLVGVLHAR